MELNIVAVAGVGFYREYGVLVRECIVGHACRVGVLRVLVYCCLIRHVNYSTKRKGLADRALAIVLFKERRKTG